MGFQKFERGCGLHLGRNDTEQIVLNAYHIDSHHLTVIYNEFQ